jgi:excisionase family DNA binding protein
MVVSQTKESFVNVKDASQYLGIKENTVRLWCQEKKIPYYKIGNLLKFKLSELERWAAKKKVNRLVF